MVFSKSACVLHQRLNKLNYSASQQYYGYFIVPLKDSTINFICQSIVSPKNGIEYQQYAQLMISLMIKVVTIDTIVLTTKSKTYP